MRFRVRPEEVTVIGSAIRWMQCWLLFQELYGLSLSPKRIAVVLDFYVSLMKSASYYISICIFRSGISLSPDYDRKYVYS